MRLSFAQLHICDFALKSVMAALKIIFMGTAELSCASLEKLARDEKLFHVVAVVTQPDKPKGRELKLTPSPVKILRGKIESARAAAAQGAR